MRIFTGNFANFFLLGIMPLLNLEMWPKLDILLKQFVTRILKLLNRISCNFIVKVDRLDTFTGNSDLIIFREHRSLMGKAILFYASCVKPIKYVYMNINDREAV